MLGDADAVIPLWPQCRSSAGAEWEPVATFAGVEGAADGAAAGARDEEAVRAAALRSGKSFACDMGLAKRFVGAGVPHPFLFVSHAG